MERSILIVDDEPNILRTLARLLRHDNYRIYTAQSGQEGLDILSKHSIGLIISDQRMPQMCGTEFLSQVKILYPDTVRIVLSGYTDLASITKSVNKGAIYKFFTKPWDDDALRMGIHEAYEHYELGQQNKNLMHALQLLNQQLGIIDPQSPGSVTTPPLLLQQVFEHLPVGLVCIDTDGAIVLANPKAHQLLAAPNPSLLGCQAVDRLPAPVLEYYLGCVDGTGAAQQYIDLPGNPLQAYCTHAAKGGSRSRRTYVLVLASVPIEST